MNGLNGSIAFWSAITGFKKSFKTLRTCVTNISYVTNMCNQISFSENYENKSDFAWKSQNRHENTKISKKQQKHAASANITPWQNPILFTLRPSSITFYTSLAFTLLINVLLIEHAWHFMYYGIGLCIEIVPIYINRSKSIRGRSLGSVWIG